MKLAASMVLCAVALCITVCIPRVALAQNLAIADLATRTAKDLFKARSSVFLIAPEVSCNLAPSICQSFDGELRTILQQHVPTPQIVGEDEVVVDLKKNGFLAIDAYDQRAMRLVGLSKGVDILTTEALLWEKDSYRLTIKLWNLKTDEQFVPFHTLEIKVPRPDPDVGDNPLLVNDPDTKVSIILPKGPLPKGFVHPGCVQCPDPPSVGARGVVGIVATINIQGKVENAAVVMTPGAAFTKAALDVLRTWTFRPAVGTDGKPFATRNPVEVTFSH